MPPPQKIVTDRRSALKQLGLALLTVEVFPAVERAAAASLEGADGNLVIRSGQGFVPHTHDLWIPYALLRAPPQGVTLTTTLALNHTHPVTLSHDQLAAVNDGRTVSVKGGSHTFLIAKALAVRDPIPPSQAQRSEP